jgi:hypothetical protein
VQITAQEALEIFAESDKEFFYKAVDAQVTFNTDSHGRATDSFYISADWIFPAAGIAAPSARHRRRRNSIAPSLLDVYVGRYQHREHDVERQPQRCRLFAQLTSQPDHEVFAEGERVHYKVVDAQLIFLLIVSVVLRRDPSSRACDIRLSDPGRAMTAARRRADTAAADAVNRSRSTRPEALER